MLRKGCHSKLSSVLTCMRLRNIVWASGRGAWKQMNERWRRQNWRDWMKSPCKCVSSLYLRWEKRAGNPLIFFFSSIVEMTKLWPKEKLSKRSSGSTSPPPSLQLLLSLHCPWTGHRFFSMGSWWASFLSTGTPRCHVQANFSLGPFFRISILDCQTTS